ncbi:MAG: cytochrome c-type biogenesis protein CcmH [Oligoflexales bacterium]
MHWLHRILRLTVFCSVFLSVFALAEVIHDEGLSPEQAELYKDISYQLRCPTCTGLSILESDAQFSLQIREAVREQVLAGRSRSDILDFFTVRYGLWILREPPKEGFHLLAWLLPIGILLVGGTLIWLLLWRRRYQIPHAEAIAPTNELKGRMNDELEQLRVKEQDRG